MFRKKIVDEDYYRTSGEDWVASKFAEGVLKNVYSGVHAGVNKIFSFAKRDIPKNAILGEPYKSFSKYYERAGELGSGNFGEVYIVSKKGEKRSFACKEQDKTKITMQGLEKLVLNECLIMKHLTGHPNVVTLEKAFEDKTNVYFVMDLCTRGDVLQTIRRHLKTKGFYTEADAAGIAREMFSAIKYCHDKGVIHRDIKPENFLWTGNDVMKVTDFGLSAFFQEGEKFTNTCGSPPYVAPEVWNGKPYDKQIDVWALGVTLYIMLAGRFPFRGETLEDLKESVTTQEFDYDYYPFNFLSDDGRDLLMKLLKKDPNERITIEQALEHPWMMKGGTAPNENISARIECHVDAFLNRNVFIKAAMSKLSEQINQQDYEKFREMFREMDTDRDGKLSVSDLKSGLKHFSVAGVERLFEAVSKDDQCYIEYEEFLVAALQLRAQIVQDKIGETFKMLDVDGNGKLRQDHLRDALSTSHISDTELEHVFNEMDNNKDGWVDWEEFCEYWRNNVATKHQISQLH